MWTSRQSKSHSLFVIFLGQDSVHREPTPAALRNALSSYFQLQVAFRQDARGGGSEVQATSSGQTKTTSTGQNRGFFICLKLHEGVVSG